jgi:hypothetical protein
MSPIEPTHQTQSSAAQSKRRRWRRRQIIATYASYAVVMMLESVRAHATLGSGARQLLFGAWGLAVIAFIVSLVWLVAPSVRYGLSTQSYRQPTLTDLKRLRDQGVSAREAHAMFYRPADERQRAIREHARAVAYQIIGPVIAVVVFYLIFAPTFFSHPWLPSNQIEETGLLLGLALVFSTLPAAVIAWSEPDPLPDDAT